MRVIPAIDVLGGSVVRLRQGNFDRPTTYGVDPLSLALTYAGQGARELHLVDLRAAKEGGVTSESESLVSRLREATGLVLQVGGGVRSLRDIERLLDAGASRVVVGTLVLRDPDTVRGAALLFGVHRIVAAIDCREREVRVSGWREGSGVPVEEALGLVRSLGLREAIVTDIDRDGMGSGPNVELYSLLRCQYPDVRITASGGVRSLVDLQALQDVGCEAAIVGTAFLEGNLDPRSTFAAFPASSGSSPPSSSSPSSGLAIRVIPCLDVAGGRVVKGTKFQNLRDAGDPVELARRYCEEGADELVFLDIRATGEARETVYELAAKVAEAVNIPFTIGGGVRSVADARRLLAAGADKVSVNSAAVRRPTLLSEMAGQLGRANTVCAIDAKRRGEGWIVLVRGGTEEAGRDAVAWAEEAVQRGAGELLVTSFDRDGTGGGFDTELLRRIKDRVSVPVIASGGAGSLQSFVDAVEEGKADAVLAASLFHFGIFTIRQVKGALQSAGYPVRPPDDSPSRVVSPLEP